MIIFIVVFPSKHYKGYASVSDTLYNALTQNTYMHTHITMHTEYHRHGNTYMHTHITMHTEYHRHGNTYMHTQHILNSLTVHTEYRRHSKYTLWGL